MKHSLIVILLGCLFSLASCSKANTLSDSQQMNRSALLMMNREEVITVVGHKSQDPDAVCSCIAMSELMNTLGMKAKPVMQNEAAQGVKYILDRFNYQYPDVQISIEKNKPLLLMDHNDPLQSLKGMPEADIVGLIDHHGISDNFTTSSSIYTRIAKFGSTNTLVYSIYTDCGIVPSKQIAGILLSGIIADTHGLSQTAITPVDSIAVLRLTDLSGVSDVNALSEEIMYALSCYDGMTDKQILESDIKEYLIEDVHLAVANISASDDYPAETLQKRISSQFQTEMAETEVSMIFSLISDNNNQRTLIPFAGEDAQQILTLAYPEGIIKGNYMIIDAIIGRKSHFIPRITAAIQQYF